MFIQITTSTFGQAGRKPLNYLEENKIVYKTNPYGRRLSEDEAVNLLADVDGVIAGTEPLTKKVLEQLPKLKVISRCGTGLSNVDLETAKKRGVKVFNTPDIHVDAVAELALAGTLAIMRKLSTSDQDIRSGKWKKTMGKSLYGKNIGLIGFGKVGRRFAELLSVFTKNIFYYDPFLIKNSAGENKYTSLPLEELLSISDVISIHIPYSKDNHNIIGVNEFKLMKPDAVLLNTSRGGLVDENLLYEFLKNNHQAGAYIDVFEEEPYQGKLSELNNILLTPHIGTTTKETREEMEYQACVNLINGLENE